MLERTHRIRGRREMLSFSATTTVGLATFAIDAILHKGKTKIPKAVSLEELSSHPEQYLGKAINTFGITEITADAPVSVNPSGKIEKTLIGTIRTEDNSASLPIRQRTTLEFGQGITFPDQKTRVITGKIVKTEQDGKSSFTFEVTNGILGPNPTPQTR